MIIHCITWCITIGSSKLLSVVLEDMMAQMHKTLWTSQCESAPGQIVAVVLCVVCVIPVYGNALLPPLIVKL